MCVSRGCRTYDAPGRMPSAQVTRAFRVPCMLHADEGKDTSTFDDAVWSAPLETPVKVRSQWGTHLVLVEGRGAPVKHDDDGESATTIEQRASSLPRAGEGAAW